MVQGDPMLAAFGTGIALIGLCSAPAAASLVTRIAGGKHNAKKEDTYEDADGKATPESVKAYSAWLPKSLVLGSASAGCGVSVALLALSPRAEEDPGRLLVAALGAAAWVGCRAADALPNHQEKRRC